MVGKKGAVKKKIDKEAWDAFYLECKECKYCSYRWENKGGFCSTHMLKIVNNDFFTKEVEIKELAKNPIILLDEFSRN